MAGKKYQNNLLTQAKPLGYRHNTMRNQLTPFEEQIRTNIRAFIRQAKRDGTIKMGWRNLLQCVKTPPASLQGAPMGTNAEFVYASMFLEIATRDFAAFLINER